MIIRKPRSLYIISAIALLISETLIALYVRDGFVRPYLGDLIATVVLYCIIMSLTNLKVTPAIAVAVLCSYIVELLQLTNLIIWLGLADNKWASVMMGTSFSWMDMLMYTLGGGVLCISEKIISMKI